MGCAQSNHGDVSPDDGFVNNPLDAAAKECRRHGATPSLQRRNSGGFFAREPPPRVLAEALESRRRALQCTGVTSDVMQFDVEINAESRRLRLRSALLTDFRVVSWIDSCVVATDDDPQRHGESP